MKKTVLKNLFALAKYFGVASAGAFIAVMIEYGFVFDLFVDVISAVLVAICYGYAERKVATENERN